MFSQQHLFRAQALQQYAQRREKAVLPRFVTPPVFLCFWLLLGLLLLATTLAWQVQVPIYRGVSGALLEAPLSSQQATHGWQAILFVPATPLPELHIGAALTIQVVLTNESFAGTIASVRPEVLTPDQARQQFGLRGDLALVITEPSVVVQVTLAQRLPADAIPDSSLSAQVPVGQQSVLSLLPQLLSGLIGG